MTNQAEKLAEQLHIWYLEATKKLNPKSYNPKAQKAYEDLTDEQKFIDKYIAQAILSAGYVKLDEEKIVKILSDKFYKERHLNFDEMIKTQAKAIVNMEKGER